MIIIVPSKNTASNAGQQTEGIFKESTVVVIVYQSEMACWPISTANLLTESERRNLFCSLSLHWHRSCVCIMMDDDDDDDDDTEKCPLSFRGQRRHPVQRRPGRCGGDRRTDRPDTRRGPGGDETQAERSEGNRRVID